MPPLAEFSITLLVRGFRRLEQRARSQARMPAPLASKPIWSRYTSAQAKHSS